MATPENQLNPQLAQLQQLLQGIHPTTINFLQLLPTALALRGAMPVLLSKANSINMANVCRYEPVERMEISSEIKTLTGKSVADIDKLIHKTKQGADCEVNIISDLRFVADAICYQQIEIVTSIPTGEFDPAIVMTDGQQIILTEEENEIFRENWMQQAVLFNEYLQLSMDLFPQAEIDEASAALTENEDGGSDDLETGTQDLA